MEIIRIQSPEELGRDIREFRYALNMKQTDLSEKAGVPIATLRRIERGVKKCSFDNFLKIMTALDRGVYLNYDK